MEILKNKTCIITGAGSGLGKAIAKLFAENGANIVAADIDEESGKSTVEDIKAKGGTAFFAKVNTANPEDHQQLVQKTVDTYGQLDIAVNNAGIGGDQSPIGSHPIDSWKKTIDINLSGVFYGMRYQIPAMLNSGKGSIINMSSIGGSVGLTGENPGYVAAKHGVVGLTKSAALAYSKKNIRTNAIAPGYVNTPLIEDNLSEEEIEALVQLHPMGRLGKPEEIAELALWLASEKSSFVTGGYYPVDGAYLSQ